jgi:HEAT repeat protein
MAAQLTGCAQTAQWVGRWTGNSSEEQLADIDGRARSEAYRRYAGVKIASGRDGAQDRKLNAKDQAAETPAGDSASERKVASADDWDQVVARRIARASATSAVPDDPIQHDAQSVERALAKQTPSAARSRGENAADSEATSSPAAEDSLAAAQRSGTCESAEERAEQEIRAASHRAATEPDWIREEAARRGRNAHRTSRDQQSPVTTTGVPASEKPMPAGSKPSVKYLSVCPNARGEVRDLIAALEDQDVEPVRRSLHRLGRIGPEAIAALPALEQAMRHADGNVRIHAALAICRINGVSAAAIQTLTRELKSPDAGARSFAAAVLAEIGPLSRETIPMLAQAMGDRDPYVRLHVAEVLIRDDEWSYAALGTLLDCLADSDENVRWLAAYSLAELAPQSEDAVGALTGALKDSSDKVRVGAVYALGEIGGLSAPALGNLRGLDQARNPELRSAVAYAVERIEAAE